MASLRDNLLARRVVDEDELRALERWVPYKSAGLAERLYRSGLVSDAQLCEAFVIMGATDGTAELVLGLPPPAALGALSKSVAERHRAIPLRVERARLVVAMLDPSDTDAIERVAFFCGLAVEPRAVRPRVLFAALHKAYGIAPILPDAAFLATRKAAPAGFVEPPNTSGLSDDLGQLPAPSPDTPVRVFGRVAPPAAAPGERAPPAADPYRSPLARSVVVAAASMHAGLEQFPAAEDSSPRIAVALRSARDTSKVPRMPDLPAPPAAPPAAPPEAGTPPHSAGIARSEAGTPPTPTTAHSEAGTPRHSAGTAPSEAGTPPHSAGTAHSEAGTLPHSAGTAHSEAGRPPHSAGTARSEAGTPPVPTTAHSEAGTPSHSAGTAPSEAGTPIHDAKRIATPLPTPSPIPLSLSQSWDVIAAAPDDVILPPSNVEDTSPSSSPALIVDEAALDALRRSLPPGSPLEARDSLPPQVLRLLVPPFRAAALFLVRNTVAVGWAGMAMTSSGLAPPKQTLVTDAIRDVLLPLTGPSAFERAKFSCRVAIGNANDPSTVERITWRHLKLPLPSSFVVLPILVGAVPQALLYVDRADGPMDDPLVDAARRVGNTLADGLAPFVAQGTLFPPVSDELRPITGLTKRQPR